MQEKGSGWWFPCVRENEKETPKKAASAEDTSSSSRANEGDLTKTGYLASQESNLAQTATQDTTKVKLELSSVAPKSAIGPLAPSKVMSTSSPLASSTMAQKSQEEETQSEAHSTPLSRSVKSWTTKQVAQLLRETPQCAPYARAFEENEIDGEALTLLKFTHFVDPPLSMKLYCFIPGKSEIVTLTMRVSWLLSIPTPLFNMTLFSFLVLSIRRPRADSFVDGTTCDTRELIAKPWSIYALKALKNKIVTDEMVSGGELKEILIISDGTTSHRANFA
ncbi:unnamed protein product [Taenia asiatica]|uniref:SAM domain-containing protein n=1 Tax=Taenia asiatica TaxID=60517 RepID=A0A0R3W9J4_TAEAS|nr:unnamed protein product [Taenia asiatica]